MFRISNEKKREHIAKIAGDIFFVKGYKETSLQDISIKAKISKAGTYHYFKTKENILSYLMLQHGEGLLNTLKESIRISQEEKLNPQKAFEVLMKEYTSYLLKNRKISLIVLRDRHQLTGKEKKDLMSKEVEIFQTVRSRMSKVSDIKKNININLMTFQVISAAHWMGYWFDTMGSISESESIDQMMNIIFKGILVSKT